MCEPNSVLHTEACVVVARSDDGAKNCDWLRKNLNMAQDIISREIIPHIGW